MNYNSRTITTYHAVGSGGQIIAVIPDLEMVIALTGGNYEHEFVLNPYDIMESYILKSVR